MESPSINLFSIPLLSIGFNNHTIFVVWFIRASFFKFVFVCVCLESNSASCHVFWGLRGQKLSLKRQPLAFISPLPALEPESPLYDRILCLWHPSPRHCSSWWCHKWRIMILARGTDEVRRNKDLLCLQLSLVIGRWGWEVKHWTCDTPHDDRTIYLHTELCESSRVWLLKYWLTAPHPYPHPHSFSI